MAGLAEVSLRFSPVRGVSPGVSSAVAERLVTVAEDGVSRWVGGKPDGEYWVPESVYSFRLILGERANDTEVVDWFCTGCEGADGGSSRRDEVLESWA